MSDGSARPCSHFFRHFAQANQGLFVSGFSQLSVAGFLWIQVRLEAVAFCSRGCVLAAAPVLILPVCFLSLSSE